MLYSTHITCRQDKSQGEKREKMAAELVKMYKNLQHYCVLVIFREMLFVNKIYRRSGKCDTKSRIYMNSVHRGGIILHGVDGTSFGGKNEKKGCITQSRM